MVWTVCTAVIMLILTTGMYSTAMESQPLQQPDRWFSAPHVGITEIQTRPDGLTARYRGTIAYKNRLDFEKLQFALTVDPELQSGNAMQIDFNKERRDSSVFDHHHQGFGRFNRGYGLLFSADGTAAIVKLTGEKDIERLTEIPEKITFGSPVQVCIRQRQTDQKLTITVSIEGFSKDYTAVDQLQEGYSASGFLGLTLFGGRAEAILSNISLVGKEQAVNLNETPRAVSLADYFEESGRKLVHWRYDDWTSDYYAVRVMDANGSLVDTVRYPMRYWVVPKDLESKTVQLQTINVDGNTGAPVSVELVDRRRALYVQSPQPRIRIAKHNGKAVFCRGQSSEPFFIKGFNYVQLRYGDHAVFEAATPAGPAGYDPLDTESAIMRIKQHGYNTIRVFLSGRHEFNPGISGYYDHEGLYAPYMENVIDFLRCAQRYGIYVLPTLCDGELPRSKTYWTMMEGAVDGLTLKDIAYDSHNAIYFTPQGHRARAHYASSVVAYIKAKAPDLLGVLLALQFQNEITIRGGCWPFDQNSGTFTGVDGKLYDMSDNAQRQQLFENTILTYHQTMADAVKAIDPELLVTEGMYVPRIAGKDYAGANFGVRLQSGQTERFPPQASVVLRGAVDFVDVHIYYVEKSIDLSESYRLDMISTGFSDTQRPAILTQKPFMIGEFGSFKFIAPTPQEAMQDILATQRLGLKDDAQGLLMWTFNTSEQRSLWNAVELGKAFMNELSQVPPKASK